MLWKGHLFLPHMMFYTLGKNYTELFHQAFCLEKGSQENFWQGVQKTGDDKLEGHPMSLEKDWQKLCIPLYVHGDGVEFSNNGNDGFFLGPNWWELEYIAHSLATGQLPQILSHI